MATIYLFDEQHRMQAVNQTDVVSFVQSPGIRFASRYQLANGVIMWGAGNRGWYDEHKLQGGLRTINYRQWTTTEEE